jgi:5,10-methylenetetrahydromethanopterin reductase
VADIVDDVVRAEADGFGSTWSVNFSRGVDALDVLAVVGARTGRINLGVGIVPTYPRHELALAQQAATPAGGDHTQAFCSDRPGRRVMIFIHKS